MRYAIDGSNVLLGLRLNKKPSTRLLARLLYALKERGTPFQLFFDRSVEERMKVEGLAAEWRALRDANPYFANTIHIIVGTARFYFVEAGHSSNQSEKMLPLQLHLLRK